MIYPGLPDHPQAALARRQMETGGTMLALELAGGKAAAFRFLDALAIVLISNNLGDAKSLVTHPATTTHQRLSAGAARRRSASATGWCAFRSDSRIRTTFWPISCTRWRQNEQKINLVPSKRLHFPSIFLSGCSASSQARQTSGCTFQSGGTSHLAGRRRCLIEERKR